VSAEITPHARELSATTAEKLASSRDGFASRFHFFLQIYYLVGHAIAPGRFALDLAVSLGVPDVLIFALYRISVGIPPSFIPAGHLSLMFPSSHHSKTP
jgi:hypothetical protein